MEDMSGRGLRGWGWRGDEGKADWRKRKKRRERNCEGWEEVR